MRERITTSESIELPRNIDLERMVLGALLLSESPERILEVRASLADDAFMGTTREIYATLGAMAEHGGSINPVMLACRLTERGAKVDAATIASLTDDAPIRSDLTTEIRELRKLATLRAIMRETHDLFMGAQSRDADADALARRFESAAADIKSKRDAKADASHRIAVSWSEACLMEFPPQEYVLNGIVRGEVVNCSAITERGKSTLWRNITLSMACGRGFAPVVDAGKPRRILYLDFETRWPRLYPDITKMLGKFTQAERALISENFHVVADCRIDNWPLSLSLKPHWDILEAEVHRIRPDVVIIDTLSVAFNIENEQDNAEASRTMKKMAALAEKWGCVVVFLHHIGKIKQEEGGTAQAVYRSRGASAYSGCAHAIFNLLPDSASKERFTLECPKLKGEKWPNTVFDIDKESRWCISAGVQVKTPTPYEQVIAKFNGKPLRRADIIKLLPLIGKTTIDDCLKKGVETGDLFSPARGTYQKSPISGFPDPYKEREIRETPQTADGAEDSLDFRDFDEEAAGNRDSAIDADEDRYLRAIGDE